MAARSVEYGESGGIVRSFTIVSPNSSGLSVSRTRLDSALRPLLHATERPQPPKVIPDRRQHLAQQGHRPKSSAGAREIIRVGHGMAAISGSTSAAQAHSRPRQKASRFDALVPLRQGCTSALEENGRAQLGLRDKSLMSQVEGTTQAANYAFNRPGAPSPLQRRAHRASRSAGSSSMSQP